MVVAPANSNDDYWQTAVQLFTGYPMPARQDLFDNLVGNDKIPLMQVELVNMETTAQDSIFEVTRNLYWRSSNSGTSIEEKNIIVPFYMPKDGSTNPPPGTPVHLRQAKIRLLGSRSTASPPVGGVDDSPGDFGDFSDLKLKQYSYGGGMALKRLLEHETTIGFEWNGLQVAVAQAVDTRTFGRAADAFTRAAVFFDTHSKVLASWQNRLGDENPVWQGQAAGVFWDLIHKLNKLYESYQEDLPRIGTFSSKQAEQLKAARRAFVNAVQRLHDRWEWWQLWLGNPLRWLHDNLLDLTHQIWEENIKRVRLVLDKNPDRTASPGSMVQADIRAKDDRLLTEEGFQVSHKLYGPYNDIASWKLVGEQGIREWQNSVIRDLGGTAKDAIMDVQRAFGVTLKPVTSRGTVSLSQDLASDTAKRDKEEAEKQNKEAQEKQDKYIQDQEKKQAEAEAKQDAKEKEQEKKQAELEAKQEAKEKEAEAKQDAKEKEQEKKQAELEAKQEAKEKEAEAKQKEAEAKQEAYLQEQEKKQAEAEAKQDAKEKEQEKKQAEAEQEAEARQKEAEAKQEAKEKEQEKKQAELEAQQEAKQKQADAEQAEAEKQAEAKQKEAEAQQEARQQEQEQAQTVALVQARAAQDKEQKEQEKKQAELEAEQEAKQKEADAKQSELEAEQEVKEKEAEAKQEAKEKEQEKKQAELEAEQEAKQKEADAKQAELEAKQEAQQKEAEAKQAEAEKQADAKQAELEAKQEKKQAEAEAKQEAKEKEAEAKQKEAETRQAEAEAKQEAYLKEQEARQQQEQQRQTQQQDQLQREQEQRQQQLQKQYQQQIDSAKLPDFRDSRTAMNPDGSLTTDFSDGSFTTVDPAEHTAVTVAADGSVDVQNLPAGHSIHNPDGSWTTLNSDGTVTTDYPDGRSTVIDPSRAVAETTFPDGTSELSPLGPGGSLPTYRDGSTDYSSPYEEQLYDDQPYDPSDLLSQRGQSTSGSSATSPMSPMLPPGTMLSGQTSGGSQGERVRTVVNDTGPATRTARRVGGQIYDEVGTAPAMGTTTSGMPFMPPMGGGAGAPSQSQTESSDRARSAWEPEEEDVWGTDEGGAPASIGR
ncbi:AAWKG family protein [Streptomyces sp. NPDC006654]|uniref:AAWKG family protein n=1 Tax=Streptomyces sp. NPDC006654 TaxID=3156897 RepID=UPI0033F9C1A5